MVIVSVARTYIFRLAANIESRVLLFMFAAFDHSFELASGTSDVSTSHVFRALAFIARSIST